MVCEDCNEIQRLNALGKKCAFLRIGIGDVLIGACDLHFNLIRTKEFPHSSAYLDSPVARMSQ